MDTHIHTHSHTHAHTHMHTHRHTHTHTHTHTDTHTSVPEHGLHMKHIYKDQDTSALYLFSKVPSASSYGHLAFIMWLFVWCV